MELAGALRKVYDKIKKSARPSAAEKISVRCDCVAVEKFISADPLNKIFGMSHEVNNGMVKVSIGHPAHMHGVKIDNACVREHVDGFARGDDTRSRRRFRGDQKDELQPALKRCAWCGINIVAIHSHMTYEQPRILFFPYWVRSGQNTSRSPSQRGTSGLRLVPASTTSGQIRTVFALAKPHRARASWQNALKSSKCVPFFI